jgi:hypothetical protein
LALFLVFSFALHPANLVFNPPPGSQYCLVNRCRVETYTGRNLTHRISFTQLTHVNPGFTILFCQPEFFIYQRQSLPVSWVVAGFPHLVSAEWIDSQPVE